MNRKSKPSKSGYKGILYEPRGYDGNGFWYVNMPANVWRENIYKWFNTAEEAVVFRMEKMIEKYGDYLNKEDLDSYHECRMIIDFQNA